MTWLLEHESGSRGRCCGTSRQQPVCLDGIVYISLQSGGIAAQWINSIDQAETGNRDGKVTKAELQAFIGKAPVPEAFFRKTFDRGDTNGDGALEGAELDKAFLPRAMWPALDMMRRRRPMNMCWPCGQAERGDVTQTHVLWKHATKHTDHIVSPMVAGGRMLLVKTGGIATCFETARGNRCGDRNGSTTPAAISLRPSTATQDICVGGQWTDRRVEGFAGVGDSREQRHGRADLSDPGDRGWKVVCEDAEGAGLRGGVRGTAKR